MAVTIKDVAREAGVSHATVSRALRGHSLVATATAERIAAIAKRMGYVPNTVARGLKTNSSNMLGVIVRRITDPFFAEVLQGIEEYLQSTDYSLFLAASRRDAEREKSIVRTMSEHRVDGVIICSTEVGEEHRRQLEQFGVPTVLVNNQAVDSYTYSVDHDDFYGSRLVTRHLIELGHRRIGYIANNNAGRTNSERYEGFCAEMAAHEIPVEQKYIIPGPDGKAATGAYGAEQLRELDILPTAVVCFNDMIAIGAMQSFQGVGLPVPGAISVVGFDNIDLSAFVTPPLTTFDQPKREIGFGAAKMLVELLEHRRGKRPQAKIEKQELRGELLIRATTAPPNDADIE